MFSLLSLKNLLFKKMLINSKGYFSLYLYFIFYKYKIFLFIQKSQLFWNKVANILVALSLSNNYMQMSSSMLKLLFKFSDNLNFFYRELILIFSNDSLLISNALSEDIFLGNIVFFCYFNFFINIKYLGVVNKLFHLFIINLNSLKIHSYFVVCNLAYYFYFVLNNIKI